MTYTTFEKLISDKSVIHLVGIGGVSMRALAEYLHHLGANVRGSDRDFSPYIENLIAMGIPVVTGHKPENADGAALIIRTAAVSDHTPEIIRARELSIPIIERAEAWGMFTARFPHSVCVAGTHGKTSTTSMIATFAQSACLDPTVMVGGDLPAIGGTLRVGKSDLMVAEACEYKNSFLSFHPTIAVILNIDRDHLDFFSDTDDIIASFAKFASLVPKDGGVVIANGDDENTARAISAINRRVVTFGRTSKSDIYSEAVAFRAGMCHCDVMHHGKLYCHMELNVPGDVNMLNALAAAAVAIELNVSGADFARGIVSYMGVGRRFEFKREWHGARVFDDYAHHPSEISATLLAARSMSPARVICVFQPHTYSRTIALMSDFAKALSKADLCILCDIYAAREQNSTGITSKALADLIPNAVYIPDFAGIVTHLKEIVRPSDLIFTMGAGDIYKIDSLLQD